MEIGSTPLDAGINHPIHRNGYVSIADDKSAHVPSRVVVVDLAHSWHEIIKQADVKGALTVVHFSAEWCAPCKLMAPIFDELSCKYPHVFFLEVDVDEVKEVAAQLEVKAMPTLIFIKEEEQVDKFVGANKVELEKRIRYLLNSHN